MSNQKNYYISQRLSMPGYCIELKTAYNAMGEVVTLCVAEGYGERFKTADEAAKVLIKHVETYNTITCYGVWNIKVEEKEN